MPKKFTNVRNRLATISVPEVTGRSPYLSKGPISSLTSKEKEARRIQKVSKTANYGGGGGGNTTLASAGQFFSPQLSTDFLELPQSLREKREIYRHFYNTDPIVGQAIDLHTELPLSKVRLATPKPSTFPEGFKDQHDYASYILWFFTDMCKRIKLFQRLVTMVHHYWLDGSCFVFSEDTTVDVPDDIGYDKKQVGTKSSLTPDGETKEEPEFGLAERPDREDQELLHYQKNYKGWDRLIVLPIDQVKVTTYSFTDKMRVELIPSDRDRALIEQAKSGDPIAEEMANEIPDEVREHISQGKLIPLSMDPDEGSFVYHMSGRKGAGEDLGQSILDRCHLPGTLVLGKREGLIQQLPIEELDPDTDLVLSATGCWREFEVGVRSVSEAVSLLKVSKIHPPVGCTKDHGYRILRDGLLMDVLAGEVLAGDYLQVPQVPLLGSVSKLDLAAFIDGKSTSYIAKRSGNNSSLDLKVIDNGTTHITVRYQRDETDPKKIGRLSDLNTLLSWAETLSAPVQMRSAQACEKFGLKSQTLKELRSDLVALGYGVTVTKGKQIVFPPNAAKIKAPSEVSFERVYPKWLDLNSGLGYVLGYFLGDGYITKIPLGETFNIVYSKDEPASVLSLKHIWPVLENLGVRWNEYPLSPGMQQVQLPHDVFARWVSSNFGYACEDKHLPEWIHDAPRDFLYGLLRGFVDSDGSVSLKKDGSVSVVLGNSNSTLTDQLLLLCLSLGIPASKTKPTKSRWVRQPNGSLSWAKPLHMVHFTHAPTVHAFFDTGFLAKRKNPVVWKDGRSGSRHVLHEGRLYYRVSEVTEAFHNGPVYSLNVHEDHSFYASWAATKNCLRVLMYKEKLRQAQTQIASRAMTPKRIVWGDRISQADVDDLREQVDLALVDPDYSIVTNYEIHWEEMGAKDRLLDLSSEYEICDKQLHAGLGVTESLLSGETLYSGDRLKLEVINTRYLFLREMVQEYVEEYLFKPVARRKGFVEKNAWGGEVVIYPKLSFTRLPLRDSQDTYDALFNLYQKGSIDISLILEMFNIDPDDTRVKIENDLFTVNDATFNEVIRGIYNAVGQKIADESNVADKIRKYLKLEAKPQEEAAPESRF